MPVFLPQQCPLFLITTLITNYGRPSHKILPRQLYEFSCGTKKEITPHFLTWEETSTYCIYSQYQISDSNTAIFQPYILLTGFALQ